MQTALHPNAPAFPRGLSKPFTSVSAGSPRPRNAAARAPEAATTSAAKAPKPHVAAQAAHRRQVASRSSATLVQARTQQYASFEEMILASDVPVLVDFHAHWCGPCQMMSSVVSVVADALKGKLKVVKIDTDKYPKVASKYKVQALPTLMLFRDGRAVDRVEGFVPEPALSNRVRYYLAGMDKKFGRR